MADPQPRRPAPPNRRAAAPGAETPAPAPARTRAPRPGPQPGEDVIELADLRLIQRFSLVVSAATAERREVIDLLRSDLDWLAGRAEGAR